MKALRGLIGYGLILAMALLTQAAQAVERLRDIEGAQAYEAEQYGEAAKRFTDPYRQGNAHYMAGDYAAARDAYTAALGSAPQAGRREVWHNLGNSYFQLQQYQAALEAYDQALKLVPGDADSRHNRELAARMLRQQSQQSPSPAQQQRSKDEPEESNSPQAGQGDQSGESNASPEEAGGKPGDQGQPQPPSGASQQQGQQPQAGNQPEEGEFEEGQGRSSGQKPEGDSEGEGQGGRGEKTSDEQAMPDDRMLDELTDDPGQLVRNQMRQEEGRQHWERKQKGEVENAEPW